MQAALVEFDGNGREWRFEPGLLPYQTALDIMAARAAAIAQGDAAELIWFVEHPPLYTAGTSAGDNEVTGLFDFPVHQTGRGGRYTYHGPGQRVVYVMLNLKKLGSDVRRFVWTLEEWIIRSLAEFDIVAGRREGRIGVWVAKGKSEAKIAALGIRLRRWVSFHGIAVNLNPNLAHFGGIVPCGIREFGVTSLHDLGIKAEMADLDAALRRQFVVFDELITTSSVSSFDEPALKEVNA